MTNVMKHKKIYFGNLDALRSIACLMVLVSHIFSEYLEQYFPDAPLFSNPIAKFLLENGGLGVQMFFTLSGFLITYLILREIQETGSLNLFDFYKRRILRIWPVYFIVVIFVFLVYGGIKSLLKIDSVTYESPLMSLLFLSNYDLIRILSDKTMYANGMLALTWSVSVEEQFYLFWPLVFVVIPLRFYKWVIVIVLLGATLFGLSRNNNVTIIYHHTVSNFLFLGTGALLGYLVAYEHRALKVLNRITSDQWGAIFAGFILILIFAKDPLWTKNGGVVAYFIITAIFLFLVFLNQVALVQRPFELGRFAGLVSMAKYTYGLYMYHRIAGFVLQVLMYKAMKLNHGMWLDFGFVAANFSLALLFAVLSYRFIERPLLLLKNKYSVFHR